jgi:hypothetical protein
MIFENRFYYNVTFTEAKIMHDWFRKHTCHT